MTTTAIGGTAHARNDRTTIEEDERPACAVARAGRQLAVDAIARSAITSKIDGDLAAFVGNVLDTRPTPKNDDILYVGVNEYSAKAEARALEGTGVSVRRVGISSSDVHDVPTFVASLAVPPDVAREVARVLEQAPPGERGILADIASCWASAERGGTCPSRLLVSGHSGDGNEIFGGLQSLHLENVRKLAHAMPRAAAQVEDLHVSACSSSANAASSQAWRVAFPNAKSIWSYNGAAPSPATHHLLAWAHMTRGRRELPRIDDGLARANVAVWTPTRGYENRGLPLLALAAQVRQARERFDAFMNGAVVAHAHGGAAERDFRALVDYANRPGVPAEDRARAAHEAACLVRLRYYEGVRSEFAKRDGRAVADGFHALGLAVPDFAKLSRRDALAAIARFESEAARRSPTPASCLALAPLLRGFASLDPHVIPTRWCHG